MLKIAHIINPVNVTPSSDLFIAQPVTFETMRIAKEFVKDRVEVELYTAQFPEDRKIIPQTFYFLDDLDRSILDLKKFSGKRKLPLLRDVLDRLCDSSQAEYFVYSNVDIAVLPHFYLAIQQIIKQGFDGFAINRRTISDDFASVDDLPLMYASIGQKHPGYDCFVFRRDAYEHYTLGTACIGADWIGRILLANLICFSSKFTVFEDLHLTFHIGDERVWKKPVYNEYAQYNEEQAYQILTYLKKNNFSENKPFVEDSLQLIEHKRKKFSYYTEGKLSQNPIFVVGYPRSGTTLLQSFIATQENIYTFPETHFFCFYLYKWLKVNEYGAIEKACLNEFFLKAQQLTGLHFTWYEKDYFKGLAELHELTPQQLFENIVKHYLSEQVGIAELSRIRWLEKTPFHAFALENILSIYPDAQFVAIIRNPLASIYSTKKHLLKDHTYPSLATRWKNTINALSEFQKNYPDKLLIIKYEDLIQEDAGVMSTVCGFLDIQFDEKKLQNFGAVSGKITQSFEKWKNTLNTSKISKTTNTEHIQQLSLLDILQIQNIIEKEMKRYHYEMYYPIYQLIYDRMVQIARTSCNLRKRHKKSA